MDDVANLNHVLMASRSRKLELEEREKREKIEYICLYIRYTHISISLSISNDLYGANLLTDPII